MSSVYDALQRARQGGQGAIPLPQRRPVDESAHAPYPSPASPSPTNRSSGTLAPGPMAAALAPLLAGVRPLLDRDGGAVLHIVAATAGEGASTIAREFALLAATTGHCRTMLVDADRRDPQTARIFECDSGQGLVDALRDGLELDDVSRQIPGTSLSVACLVGSRRPGRADAATVHELYGRLRARFDLIVVDCPSVAEGDYLELVPEAADGVIMVVQAESTRPAVVARAKEAVQQAGGNLLGAVLNRRSNYIPDFLYRML